MNIIFSIVICSNFSSVIPQARRSILIAKLKFTISSKLFSVKEILMTWNSHIQEMFSFKIHIPSLFSVVLSSSIHLFLGISYVLLTNNRFACISHLSTSCYFIFCTDQPSNIWWSVSNIKQTHFGDFLPAISHILYSGLIL